MQPNPQYPKNHYFLAILALLVVPISGISVDIYVPSLPAVSDYFQVEKSLVQLTITTYLLGLGIMQLFAGSITDSFGRRYPYLAGMFIFILTTLLVPFSQNIHQLLFLRLLQGVAVSLTVVPMRSVVSDLFEGRELNKMMSYMTMAWSIGPIIAPAIGGYLQHYLGWQSNFYFLALYSIAIFILTLFFLKETSQHQLRFHPGDIFKRYMEILFNPKFAIAIFINGTLYSLIILFSVVGSFYIQTSLHYTAVHFGQISLLVGLAWFLGTMTNRFLIDIEFMLKSKICLWSMLVIALLMLILNLTVESSIFTIVTPICLLLWVGGIIFPNNFMRIMVLFPKNTGSANALAGSAIFCIGSLGSTLGALLKSSTILPLAVANIVLIIFCLIAFYWGKYRFS